MSDSSKYRWLIFSMAVLLVLSAISSPVWYDDAGHFLVANEGFKQGSLCHPQDLVAGICDSESPYITMGPAPAWALVGRMKVVGNGMSSARVLFVLLSMAFLAWLFKVVEHHFSSRKAVWTVLLVGVNIQFLTYGAEVLGEVPMLLGAWGAVGSWLRYEEKKELAWGILTSLFLAFGLLSKAYLVLPLGLGMGVWALTLVRKSQWKRLGHAVGWWGSGLLLALLIQWISWGGWGSRGSYASEFLAFDWEECLRFLAFKPLFWAGTLALGMRLYFHRQPQDTFFACLHLGWIVFFFASAGYDRFGFQLLVVPAIYLAEFVAGLWKKWWKRWGLKLALCLVMLVLFAQKTPFLLGVRLANLEGVNAAEKSIAQFLAQENAKAVFTYDQQLIPFLSKEIAFRLPKAVPSNARNCQELELRNGEFFVAGPYARTEFQNCIPWEKLELVVETWKEETRYEVMWLAPVHEAKPMGR